MNELAIFAGVGGGVLGTQSLGIKTVCAVELEWHCRCVLVQRQNERIFRTAFPIWDDVRTFDGRAWRGRASIITGGFPCQPFSSAPRGRKTAENLWPEMKRVINEVLPDYVFAENVTRKAIEQAAYDCAEMGYKTEMLSLSAADLGGDHKRERFWLLAYADNKSELCSTINAETRNLPQLCRSVWEDKPDYSGLAYGVSRWVDRYKASGNGQVPIVAAAALWTLANAV